MKSIYISSLVVAATLCSVLAHAEPAGVFQFEVEHTTTNTPMAQPFLDLSTMSSGSMDIRYGPEPINRIENLVLKFQNAPDLKVTRLEKVLNGAEGCNYYDPYGGSSEAFTATVEDQWLFRAVDVTLCLVGGGPMEPYMSFRYLIEAQMFEAYGSVSPQGPHFELASGQLDLKNVTENPAVDIHNTEFQGKGLALELLQSPADIETPNMGMSFEFALNANWIGHGQKTMVFDFGYSTPFS